jgi:hypothetical protein
MSLSQIIMACNFLLEGNLKSKFAKFIQNKAALAIVSVYFLHLLGLLYTTNFAYAANDLRIKLPMFSLPILLAASTQPSLKDFKMLLWFFIVAVTISTFISTGILIGIVHRPIVDIREISIFISHIRLALLICIAIVCCVYLYQQTTNKKIKLLTTCFILWLIMFLFLLQSLTGLIALSAVLLLYLILKLFRSQNRILTYSIALIVLIGASFGLWSSYLIFTKKYALKEKIDYDTVEKYTKQGNTYQFDTLNTQVENGYLVWVYYNDTELIESWNKRSTLPLSSKDKSGNDLRFTLMRYLASKGWRKDASTVAQLSDEEIIAIQQGIANVDRRSGNRLQARVYETLWEINEYNTTGDANGHSLTQRFEYWKTGWAIVLANPWIGVGTGDVEMEYNKMYDRSNSILYGKWRLGAHNQYLSIAVAFGLLGLAWFLFTLIYPMLAMHKTKDLLYVSFLCIALISFLNEDTLETQAGLTFFAFFNALFLFVAPTKKTSS